jgi:hypothetical protein
MQQHYVEPEHMRVSGSAVNEIACLIDFGIEQETVLAGCTRYRLSRKW